MEDYKYTPNTSLQKKKKKKDLLITSALFLTFHITNKFFKTQIFNFSKTLSLKTQTVNLDNFSYFFSKLFFHSLFFYIILAPFLQKKKIKSFLNITKIFFSIYFSNLLKMLYRASRPSFEEKKLRQNQNFCENDYGMPSAHTFIIIILMLVISEDFIRNFKFLGKKTVRGFCYFLMVLVVFTRVYFGVHSLNQILMGIFAGAAVYCAFGFFEDFLCQFFILPFLFKRRFARNGPFVGFLAVFVGLNFVAFFVFLFCKGWEAENFGFFEFVNCRAVLEKFPNFSYRLWVFCNLINHTFGMFLGIFFFDGDFFYACRLNYQKNWRNNGKRILVFLFLGLGMVFWKKPNFSTNGNSYFSIIQSIVVPLGVGFLQTFGIFKIFDYFNIPYQKEKKKE